jgi:hypothetical protein
MTKKSIPSKPDPSQRHSNDQPKVQTSPMDQPVGYHVGGDRIATLSEVLESATPTLSLAELTEQQWIDLTVARLQARVAELSLAMIGPGVIDRNRAIAEVRARSKVGKTLLELERMFLSRLIRQNKE